MQSVEGDHDQISCPMYTCNGNRVLSLNVVTVDSGKAQEISIGLIPGYYLCPEV